MDPLCIREKSTGGPKQQTGFKQLLIYPQSVSEKYSSAVSSVNYFEYPFFTAIKTRFNFW